VNILFVASLRGIATANYWLRALRDLGHEVHACSDVATPDTNTVCGGLVDVAEVARAASFAADLLLFIEGGTMRLFPVGLERLGCATAWYGIDTHMDYAKHLAIARVFDSTFIAQREYVERLRSDGIAQVHWIALAYAPELAPAGTPNRDLDVAYVGSMNASVHPERHALLTALRERYPQHFIGAAAPADMSAIYSRAKVVFNRSVNNDLNMRYFEAMGSGAVLVTDPIRDNGVDTLFEEGVHYLAYRDGESLLAAVDRVVGDEAARLRIASAAQALVAERHTYVERVRAFVRLVVQQKRRPAPEADAYFGAFFRLRHAGGLLYATRLALEAGKYGRADRIIGRTARVLLAIAARLAQLIDARRGR
jgi:Glycosyl transferases group 1